MLSIFINQIANNVHIKNLKYNSLKILNNEETFPSINRSPMLPKQHHFLTDPNNYLATHRLSMCCKILYLYFCGVWQSYVFYLKADSAGRARHRAMESFRCSAQKCSGGALCVCLSSACVSPSKAPDETRPECRPFVFHRLCLLMMFRWFPP